LLPMFVVSVRQSVRPSVRLSRGLTWLHCVKMAERIKMLFGMNTLGGPRNIVLDGALIPPQREEGIRCSLRQSTLFYSFLISYLWVEFSQTVTVQQTVIPWFSEARCKMNFLGQGFRKLSYDTQSNVNRHTTPLRDNNMGLI